jgi:4-amino-4-deoxy-L-arabinose transferase-like glycosyltransferase
MSVAPTRTVDDAPDPDVRADETHVATRAGRGRYRLSPHSVGALTVGFVFLTLTAPALAVRSPLGHDEAVYSLRGRDLLTGWTHLSVDYWRDYRAPGLPLMLGGLGRVIGVHVTTSRLLVVLLALVIMASTAAIGARLASRSVGLTAAALLPLVFGFSLTATIVLADTPGAAFALVAIAIYLRDVEAGRLRLSLVAVPLLAFAATMSRFGAPFMLGAGLVGVAIVFAPDVVRGRNWAVALESAGLAVAVTAVVAVVILTDTFTLDGRSPATANSDLVGMNGFTIRTGMENLFDVVNPWTAHSFPLWSKAVALMVGAGLVAAVVSVVFDRSRWRIVTFGLFAGVVSLFAVVATVGLVVPNYLVLTLPFWALVAAAGWEWMARAVFTRVRHRVAVVRVLAAVAAVGVAALVVDVGSDVRQVHQRYELLYANILDASLVTFDQVGESCVLIARYTPQAGYYSRCRIAPFDDQDWPDDAEWLAASVDNVINRWDLGVPPDAPIAVMLVRQANRQPDSTTLTERADLFVERVFEAGSPEKYRDQVTVLIVDPCVSERSCDTFQVP